jgi:hypothetical protein
MTSRLCSITSTVLHASTSRCSTSEELLDVREVEAVVGSSRMYGVFPVAT